MRIAEDRGVEAYGELKKILSGTKEEGAYFKGMFHLFKEADSKYNSGLFDFKKDTLSKSIAIDNKVIKTIVSELYYPDCPYEFSVLGVEILGSAYEQFLGKQIKLSAGHKAIIEEKPEVRKAMFCASIMRHSSSDSRNALSTVAVPFLLVSLTINLSKLPFNTLVLEKVFQMKSNSSKYCW